MNIRDFEYLIAVDELRSFVKASKKCYISQPALSQQIKKIEDQLDLKIFERDKKSIITTKEGIEVIKYAKNIMESFSKMKLVRSQEKKIRIALIPTICPYLLPHIVDNLYKEFPKIKFYFIESKTKDMIETLKSGEFDLGIASYCDDLIDDKLEYNKSYMEEFFLTVPKTSNLQEADFEQIMDDKRLILLEEGNCMSDQIKGICSIYHKHSFNDFYATNIETVKSMIRIDSGIGLLPKLSCLEEEQNLKMISFKDKKYREVGITYRKTFKNKNLMTKINDVITKSVHALL